MGSKFGWDLPPGVRHSDIPGNRPEDQEYEKIYEKVLDLIPTEFDDFADHIAKIKKSIDQGASLEDLQAALTELVNYCDTHDIELGDADIEDAATLTFDDQDDGDAAYDRWVDEQLGG